MKIAGPNGLVVDVPDAIATGMVGNGKRGYRFVSEEKPAPEEKAPEAPAPVKRGPGRPRKQPTK